MSRKPGFHHPPEVKKKISRGVKLQQQKDRERTPSHFDMKVETGKGFFYGVIEAESPEQAEARTKTFFNRLGIPLLKLELRKRIPAGGSNTFYLPLTRLPLAGRDIWAAVGRGEEFDKKVAESNPD